MRITAVIILIGFLGSPVHAKTLEGGVEKSDVEGRIGVRISGAGQIGKVHRGSPAEAAGLRKDDKVTKVDGQKDRIGHISGEPGTSVELEVKRRGERFLVVVERVDLRKIYY